MIEALDIWVQGVVQGVGFRPFIYRLAKRYLINGWVLNAADGVHIHAEGETKLLDEFVIAISEDAPAASQVKQIDIKEVPLEQCSGFEIRFSDDAEVEQPTLVSPDLATCADCERELFDENDRRYRYPFINCTNCGPRFTIIDKLPYDRANTSMNDFEMCDACQAEYDDPENRRFHAQPNACFECGPQVEWCVTGGEVKRACNREETDEIFAQAVQMLLDGKILAVKGLGGFHLVCDANNQEAVSELRKRKQRDRKPFAVMMRTLDDVKLVCHVNDEEEKILTGSARPIVLLKKRTDVNFVADLADNLPELGVMLPYTPVQHMLFNDLAEFWPTFEPPMLVMTSGNIHDEPIVTTNEAALEELGGVADAFLMNNRRIVERFDDSVVRILDVGDVKAVQFIRRARGFSPAPIKLATTADEQIFATGPEQKVTFCFLRKEEAFVSQHIGDVENVSTFDAWLEAKEKYQKLFDFDPIVLACDIHPEYLTSKWAHEQAALAHPAMPVKEVQHHHAHIVSAMSENNIDRAVCGIAFDGTGYGPDGNIWGGEVLLSNLYDYERFANFAYVPMPGGAAAIKNPLRMAYGVLWEYDLLEHPGAKEALEALGEDQRELCEKMIEQGINTPVTSSVGRLFDAASALLGICTQPSYEGEGAVLLEAAMNPAFDYSFYAQRNEATFDEMYFHDPLSRAIDYDRDFATDEKDDDDIDSRYFVKMVKNTATETSTAHDTSVILLDAEPTFTALLEDKEAGVPINIISKRFHDAMVKVIVDVAKIVESLYEIKTVVLSGGCFMNRYLVEHAITELSLDGLEVAINRDLPPNDGCISLGQAVVASQK